LSIKGRKKKSLEFVTLKSFDKSVKDKVFNEVEADNAG
jgi:hypothetical protein